MEMEPLDVFAIRMNYYSSSEDYAKYGQAERIKPDADGICRCAKDTYLEINYEDDNLTADGTPWKQKLDEIKNLDLDAVEHMKKLRKFKRGWDVHDGQWYIGGYWQWRVPSNLWREIREYYNNIMQYIHNKRCEQLKKEVTFKMSSRQMREYKMEGYYPDFYRNPEYHYPGKWLREAYIALKYENGILTADGVPWEQKLNEIDQITDEWACFKELGKFKRGWDIDKCQMRKGGYWQKKVTRDLYVQVMNRYNDIIDKRMEPVLAIEQKEHEEHEKKVAPIREKFSDLKTRFSEICKNVLFKDTIQFNVVNKELVIANNYTPHEVKLMCVFCQLYPTTFAARLTSLQKMYDIDKKVAEFNKGTDINPVNVEELDINNIINELRTNYSEMFKYTPGIEHSHLFGLI